MIDSGSHHAFSHGEITSALQGFGVNKECRRILLDAIRRAETEYADNALNVRESISGPIVDALFFKGELLQKELSNGLTVQFRYTSKIARDFVMAPDRPDHVWEPQTTKLLVALAKRAQIAVIGGAYFGDHALLVAHAMRDTGGKCYCFEINKAQLEMLDINARLNQMDNLFPVGKGLWNRDNAHLALVGDDSHASPEETDSIDGGFETVTLDSFGAELTMPQIGLLMLDIEGGELAALQGARQYLDQPAGRAPNVIFEVHRAYVDWTNGLEMTDIVRYMEELGFTLHAIRDYQSNVDMRGRSIEIIPIRKTYLEGPPHGFNVLATKDAGLVNKLELHVVEDVSPKLLFHRDPRLHQPLT